MNRLRHILVLSLLSVALCAENAGGLERGDPGYAKFSAALSYAAKGEYEEAAELLAALREDYPDDEAVTLELAKALGYTGELSGADALFESLPRDRENVLAHASVLEANQEFERAVKKYEFLLEKHPNDAAVMIKLARALSWDGEFEGAGGYYEKALGLRPGDTEVMLALAELKGSRGEYERAVSLAKVALRIEPGDTEAMLYLARFYSWSRRYSESLEMYDRLIEKEPSRALFRREMARVLGWARRYGESIQEYRDTIKKTGPDRAVEMEMRAKRNYFRLYPLKAEKYYRKWLEEEPDSLEALFDLGQLYSSQKRWEEAEDAYSEVLRIMPGHFRAEQAAEKAKLVSGGLRTRAGAAYFDARSLERHVDARYYDYFIEAGGHLSRDFKLGISLHETRYSFEEGETSVRGTRAEGGLRYIRLPRLTAEAGFEHSRYDREADSRLNPRGAVSFRASDPLRLGFSFAREDIRDNFPALSGGIRKDEYKVRAELLVSRRLSLGADYLRSDYNDDNREDRWGLELNAGLTHEPRRLSVLYRYEAFGFDERSPFYFSPDSFHTHRVSAAWRHYLNEEEMFWGAPDTYYSATYEVNFDRGGETGHKIGIDFYRDINEKLSLGFEASKTFYSPSDVYRENRAGIFARYFF